MMWTLMIWKCVKTFISSNTPSASFKVPGYNYFHVDRNICRTEGGCRTMYDVNTKRE